MKHLFTLLLLLLWVSVANASLLVFSTNGDYVTVPNLATFATSADCAGKTAVIANPQPTITTSVTVPADRSVEFRRGGKITTTGNATVTFSGAITVHGGDFQVFSPTSKIVLNGANWGNPRWWGAKGDANSEHPTDDAIPLQSAFNAGKTRLTIGQYLTGTQLTAKYDIAFDDWAATAIVAKPGTTLNPVLSISADATESIFIRTFRNLNVIASSRSTFHQSGIVFQRGPNPLGSVAILDIQNIHVSNMNGRGVVFDSVWDSSISNIHTEDCGSTVFSEAAMWVGSTSGDSANQNTFSTIQVERSVYQAIYADPATTYSNRYLGLHVEATTNIGTDIVLGGYRNQYYGAGHFGANHRYIYIGGESNVYDGMFFETTVRDLNSNPGNVYRVSNSTIVGTFDGNGGAGYGVFSNCGIGTFIANGQEFKLVNSDVGTLTYGFMSNAMYVQGGTIGTIDGNGTQGHLELNNVTVKNASTIKVRTLVAQSKFLSDLTFNYTIGSTIDASTIGGNLTLQGNTSGYVYKVNNSNITGNLWVDINEGSTIANCTIFGNATESGAGTLSYLSNSVVKGVVTGFKSQTLPDPTTATTQPLNNNSTKVATTAYADRAGGTSGYTYVGTVPVTAFFHKFGPGQAVASFYMPPGANPRVATIGTGVFTDNPYCTSTATGSTPTATASIGSAVYSASTGETTVTMYTNASSIGFNVICYGKSTAL